eukprot:1159865-Pelagomonas_calceolata.AAC.2
MATSSKITGSKDRNCQQTTLGKPYFQESTTHLQQLQTPRQDDSLPKILCLFKDELKLKGNSTIARASGSPSSSRCSSWFHVPDNGVAKGEKRHCMHFMPHDSPSAAAPGAQAGSTNQVVGLQKVNSAIVCVTCFYISVPTAAPGWFHVLDGGVAEAAGAQAGSTHQVVGMQKVNSVIVCVTDFYDSPSTAAPCAQAGSMQQHLVGRSAALRPALDTAHSRGV